MGRWIVIVVLAGCSFRAGVAASDTRDGATGSGSGIGSGSGSGALCVTSGQRVCIDSMHSGSCNGSLQGVTDRDCPPGSTCMLGYCAPPASATTCTKASDCSGGQVCDLYVVAGVLNGFCTDPAGASGTYQSCSPIGNDPSCQTGMCAHDNDGHQQCLVPCANGNDSTCPSSQSCHSLTNPTTIEGVSTSTQYGCFS